jgi:hypothetical protein
MRQCLDASFLSTSVSSFSHCSATMPPRFAVQSFLKEHRRRSILLPRLRSHLLPQMVEAGLLPQRTAPATDAIFSLVHSATKLDSVCTAAAESQLVGAVGLCFCLLLYIYRPSLSLAPFTTTTWPLFLARRLF